MSSMQCREPAASWGCVEILAQHRGRLMADGEQAAVSRLMANLDYFLPSTSFCH